MMNLGKKNFEKNWPEVGFLGPSFISLWENEFFVSISKVIKPNRIKIKYINTRGQDLSIHVPYEMGKSQ